MMLVMGMVMNAMGPNKMPWMGPKMGPVPAMLSRLIRAFFQPHGNVVHAVLLGKGGSFPVVGAKDLLAELAVHCGAHEQDHETHNKCCHKTHTPFFFGFVLNLKNIPPGTFPGWFPRLLDGRRGWAGLPPPGTSDLRSCLYLKLSLFITPRIASPLSSAFRPHPSGSDGELARNFDCHLEYSIQCGVPAEFYRVRRLLEQ